MKKKFLVIAIAAISLTIGIIVISQPKEPVYVSSYDIDSDGDGVSDGLEELREKLAPYDNTEYKAIGVFN